jgi:hypothetical protein
MAHSTGKAAQFIMLMFHSRTLAHMQHLQTRSFAAHKALNEYYDGIIDLVDAFAEEYQGHYGIIEGYPTTFHVTKDSVEMLEVLREWVEKNRKDITDKSSLQNQIDTIVELISSTLYKLKFLK